MDGFWFYEDFARKAKLKIPTDNRQPTTDNERNQPTSCYDEIEKY